MESAGCYSGAYRIGECWAFAPAWAGAAEALRPDVGSASHAETYRDIVRGSMAGGMDAATPAVAPLLFAVP